jgi:hypothetical protein
MDPVRVRVGGHQDPVGDDGTIMCDHIEPSVAPSVQPESGPALPP